MEQVQENLRKIVEKAEENKQSLDSKKLPR
jgi:hypothetical protein